MGYHWNADLKDDKIVSNLAFEINGIKHPRGGFDLKGNDMTTIDYKIDDLKITYGLRKAFSCSKTEEHTRITGTMYVYLVRFPHAEPSPFIEEVEGLESMLHK